MWEFLRTHPIPGAGLLLGPFFFVLGLMIDAHHLIELGFPSQDLEALGAIIFVLAIIGILFQWWKKNQRASLPSAEHVLVSQDAYYLPDEAARGYPHKLKIVLTNESASDIIVTPAEWQNTWNFTLPPLNEHPWQREGPRGWQNGDWESREIHEPLLVRQGRAIQTWVGLPARLDKVELRRRIVSKRLGTLIVPVTVDGHDTSETLRLWTIDQLSSGIPGACQTNTHSR